MPVPILNGAIGVTRDACGDSAGPGEPMSEAAITRGLRAPQTNRVPAVAAGRQRYETAGGDPVDQHPAGDPGGPGRGRT